MANVGVIYHPGRTNALAKAAELKSWLVSKGHSWVDLADEGAKAQMDLVVSLGGDGTMLRAIDKVMPAPTPVLGVNFGSLGYLTEVDPDQLFGALEQFFAGHYTIEERMTLSVNISRGARSLGSGDSPLESDEFVALNEIVVEKLSSGHVVRIEVSIGLGEFLTYEADGLIVATPTGSTAYSFSARGPVLSPDLRAIVLTPISPHMLFDRSLVLEPSELVGLRLAEGPPAAVMVDGVNRATIEPGDVVKCHANRVSAHLVTFARKDFHHILKMKFGLSSKRMGD